MGVEWTKEQEKVISLSERNILVSAAAGSGKTAVLVERIIQKLIRKENPVSVDQLLIVTFTEAAASEMKDRIRGAIEKKLEELPENEHLQQQVTLIHNAQITTIHSFCLSVIRDHFHKIDLDPSFRIGEDGELKLLRQDVIEEVLEKRYENATPEFLDFVEAYGDGKNDKKLEELVLKIYEFSRSHPDGDEWLDDCIKAYQVPSMEKLEKAKHYAYVKRYINTCLDSVLEIAKNGMEMCLAEDGPKVYYPVFESDVQQIKKIMQSHSYGDFYRSIKELKWMRLPVNKDKSVSEAKIARVKACREMVKNLVKDVAGRFFVEDEEGLIKDMALCVPMISVLVELTKEFARAFEEKKRSKNLIDFDDMEHLALRILTEKREDGFHPSKVAQEYQEQYSEVMIDEYQDSNLIQEAILTSVSRVSQGKYNIFMVGDVKQSIYRFRLSRPELFMEKYDSYSLEDGNTQRIDLHKNFRSRKEVLDSVNFIFKQIMGKAVGGVEYDENAYLNAGASYVDVPGNETEILMLSVNGNDGGQIAKSSRLSLREMEARAIAREVKRLMDTQLVVDKKSQQLRPVKYSDIVILTRSVKGFADIFSNVLTEEGIPVYVGTQEGYFERTEISVLLDYLSVLNNPNQDIPLAAVLRSYFGQMTDEELAIIKSRCPEKSFYQSVKLFAQSEVLGEEKEIQRKLQRFLGQIQHFRKMVVYTSIHELLWEILEETGYDTYVFALPGGEQRKANVDMLVEKAIAFEKTSYKGLFNFIRYIELLKKYEVDYGDANVEDEQSDTVRIMSIHKSKGLEFPVVIVAGMGKLFNMQDARSNVLVHAELGIGIDSIDVKNRVKAPSFLKKIIQHEEEIETLGEELRVLYVAFTRAKEKLIITGTVKNLPDLDELRLNSMPVSFAQISKATNAWDWIIPSLSSLSSKDSILVRMEDFSDIVTKEIRQEIEGKFTRAALEKWDVDVVCDEEMHQHLEEQFAFKYPYQQLLDTKVKFTVSELKKRAYLEDEEGEVLVKDEPVVPLIPKFLQEQEEVKGAERGSAYHRVFELLDFEKEYQKDDIEKAIYNMKESGKISEEYAFCIQIEDIIRFLESEAGRRMQLAAKRGMLFKEQPFVLGIPMEEVYQELKESVHGEMALIQGIIDVYFEEDGQLVVLDYKTDQVYKAEQLVERYQAQLDYYARALEQITGKKVKQKIIYSVTLKQEIFC